MAKKDAAGDVDGALAELRRVVTGAGLRRARRALGLSQGALGAVLGTHQGVVCRREKGTTLDARPVDGLALEALLCRRRDGWEADGDGRAAPPGPRTAERGPETKSWTMVDAGGTVGSDIPS